MGIKCTNIPWPSEVALCPGLKGSWDPQPAHVLTFKMPRDATDLALVARAIFDSQPGVVVSTHTPKVGTNPQIYSEDPPFAFWKWGINNASLGGAQSCLRNVYLRIKKKVPIREQIPPHFMCDVAIPSNISECLLPTECTHPKSLGISNATHNNTCNVVDPLLIGYIQLDRKQVQYGVKAGPYQYPDGGGGLSSEWRKGLSFGEKGGNSRYR